MATRYPPEFRRRAVELARLREKPITRVADELGISDATLHGWARPPADLRAAFAGTFVRRNGGTRSLVRHGRAPDAGSRCSPLPPEPGEEVPMRVVVPTGESPRARAQVRTFGRHTSHSPPPRETRRPPAGRRRRRPALRDRAAPTTHVVQAIVEWRSPHDRDL
jgi:Transposase